MPNRPCVGGFDLVRAPGVTAVTRVRGSAAVVSSSAAATSALPLTRDRRPAREIAAGDARERVRGTRDDADQHAAAQHRSAEIAETGAGADRARAVRIDQRAGARRDQRCFVQRAEGAAGALVGGAVAGDGEAVAVAAADRRRADAGGKRAASCKIAASPDTRTRRPSSSSALRVTPTTRSAPPPAITRMPRAQWAAVTTARRAMAVPVQ